jgi:hypothetical protein
VHFKVNMLLFGRAIFPFVNKIRLFECLINITRFSFNVMNNVMGCIVDPNGIRFIMDNRRAFRPSPRPC